MAGSSEVFLVSPIFPSGVAYVLNVLLELGVEIFRDGERRTFRTTPAGSVLVEEQSELKRWMPTLAATPVLRFREPLRVRWFHRWPEPPLTGRPTALLVRNGSDAIFSWQRRNAPQMTFDDFLERPFGLKHHRSRFLPNLCPADQWALFCMTWKRVLEQEGSGDACIVRFEAMKGADPVPELRRLLEHFGIGRGDGEIARAAAASSFERAREQERTYVSGLGLDPATMMNRRGQVDEWKETYGPKQKAHFRGLPDHALRALGYPAHHEAGGEPVADETDGGRELACADWARALERRGRFPEPVRRALLDALRTESRRIEPGPAFLCAAARSLVRAGSAARGRAVLDRAVAAASVPGAESFYGLLGAADCAWKCGFKDVARGLAGRMGPLAATAERRASLEAFGAACRPFARLRDRLARSARRLARPR